MQHIVKLSPVREIVNTANEGEGIIDTEIASKQESLDKEHQT